ncbi:MAG TPA: hemerythrin domain-containing protein [Mycobacteriales bacterium]|jgi:hemerythrin-like domain-containing protein
MAERDGIKVLKDEHRRMVELFQQIEETPITNGDRRKAVFEQVSTALSVHAVAEEELLYPLLRRSVPDGERLVEHALDEHQTVKETLARLERMSADNLDFEGELRTLMTNVREHIQEEEGELLPLLRQHVDQKTLDALGPQLQAAEAMAPTRPHPNAPNTPPGNVLAGAGAMIVDKARDVIQGRGKE